MERLLTPKEAAQTLGVSASTLDKWRQFGGGPEFVRFSRAVRYEPAALQKFIEQRRVKQ